MVAKLPENPDQTKRLRLSPSQFLGLNKDLLEKFRWHKRIYEVLKEGIRPFSWRKISTILPELYEALQGSRAVSNIVKIHQIGNPTKQELEAHESHLHTKEALGITKPVVAISGTVASGKTATIEHLCHKLQYELIDNGSLFRAMAYYLNKQGYIPHENGVDFLREDGTECALAEVETVIENMGLQYSYESLNDGKGKIRVLIGDEDVSEIIRSKDVSGIVPGYGGNQSVMDSVQKTITRICKETPKGGIVIGSRGYGVFMLSDANHIFHLDAGIDTRYQRDAGRNKDLQIQGITSESIEVFTTRDVADITKGKGSLRIAKNAKIINTGNGTAEEVSAILVRYIRQMQKKRVLTEKIAKAETYAELAPIAMEMIDSYIKYQQEKKLPEGMEMVCGPISTGGLGTIDANIAHFNEHIKNLVLAGNPIFDQTIFEEAILRIKTKRREDGIVLGGQYDDKILTDFYQPLFESGKIKTMHFIPGRMSSKGAIRERRQAELLGIDEIDLKTLSITSPSPN